MKYFLYSLMIFFSCSNQVTKVDGKQTDDQPSMDNETTERTKATGKLYLRTFMISSSMGSSLTIDWIYFGDDGTIVYNPLDGVDPVHLATERTNNADNFGKYKIQGDQLLITWENGKTDHFA